MHNIRKNVYLCILKTMIVYDEKIDNYNIVCCLYVAGGYGAGQQLCA